MATLATIIPCRQAQLKDGRRLAFAEFGDAGGTPVFLFHGLPGTRLYRHPDDALTASLGVRLITIDRPGLGLSDLQPDRSLLDWPEVVELLANALQIDRFAVLGHSAGGPYAAACAWRLPQRVTKAAIVAGTPPMHTAAQRANMPRTIRAVCRVAGRVPGLIKFGLRLFWRFHNFHGDQQEFIRKMFRRYPEPDRALLQEIPGLLKMLADNIEELQHLEHADGYAEELRILSTPWDFRVEDISVPLRVWQGEDDNQTSLELARIMAESAPKGSFTVIPGAGHMLLFSHWREILEDLKES